MASVQWFRDTLRQLCDIAGFGFPFRKGAGEAFDSSSTSSNVTRVRRRALDSHLSMFTIKLCLDLYCVVRSQRGQASLLADDSKGQR